MTSSPENSSYFFRLGRDFLTYGVMITLSRFAGLFLLPILTRVLSVDEYGMVDVIAMVITLMTIGIKIGTPAALARYLNDGRDEAERRKLFSTLFLFVLILGVLVAGILSIFVAPMAEGLVSQGGGHRVLQYGCGIALATALASLPKMLLRLHRRIITYGMIEFFELLLYFALVVLLVVGDHQGITGVFCAQLLSRFGSLMILVVSVRRSLCLSLDLTSLSKCLRYGIPLAPMVLVSRLVTEINRLVLLASIGLAGVGIFGAAGRVCGIFEFVLIAFSQAWRPLAMSIIAAPNRDDIYRRMLNYFSGATSTCALLFIGLAPELFQILLRPEYHEGAYLVPWLIGASVLHYSTSILNLGVLIAEKTPTLFGVSMIRLAITAVLTWWLVTTFGLHAAAIGSFISQGVYSCLLLRLSTKYSTVRFDVRAMVMIVCTFTVVAPVLIVLGLQPVYSWPLISARVALVAVATAVIVRTAIDRSVVSFVCSLPSIVRGDKDTWSGALETDHE